MASEPHTLAKGVDHEAPLHILRPRPGYDGFCLDESALRLLEEADQPVTVVSIVGNQRGGKSTLMNLLHSRKTNGFQVGHYLDPQTTGLWCWMRAHPRDASRTVLYVDSEGLDSPHVPQHYNWLLSALTLLITDVYMYQSKGSIEQTTAERLEIILRIAEQLRPDAQPGDSQAAFFWVLRDHQLQMQHNPKEEMLAKLDAKAARTLTRFFGEYDCVPLPRPAKEESALQKLDQLEFAELAGDFREEFVVLERRIQDRLRRPPSVRG